MSADGIHISSRAIAAGLAIGLAATFGAGVAVAATRGSGSAGGHSGASSSHSGNPLAQERAYLTTLRPVVLSVQSAVTPAQVILNKIVEPRAGDDFAARDGLVHGEMVANIRAANQRLRRLRAPSTMTRHQGQLVAGAAKLSSALLAFRTLSDVTSDSRLDTKINEIGNGRLSLAEAAWDTAVESTFAVGHVRAPQALEKLHTRTTVGKAAWIFGADRTCTAAAFKLANLVKLERSVSVSNGEKIDELWSHTLTFTSHGLKALPRPKGSTALPTMLSARFRVLAFTAGLFRNQLKGVRHLNLATVDSSQDQIRQSQQSLRDLATQLSHYGAKSCGLIIGEWGGKRITIASAHHTSHVST